MSGNKNRRKLCELQIQKQAYIRHISKLQQLKSGRSQEQLQKCIQQKKLTQTMNTMRKMRTFNRQFKQKQMRQIQLQSKQINFNKIKSVVVRDFYWAIPLIAPKHKKNEQPILHQNIKLFQRIISTKPNINSKNYLYTQRKNKNLPCLPPNDFSKLYQKSRLSNNPFKIIKIKFGKFKNAIKSELQINTKELFEFIKDLKSMYILEVSHGTLRGRSEAFILQELGISKVIFKAPLKFLQERSINARLIKILDNHKKKQVVKARFFLQQKKKQQNNSSQLKNYFSQAYGQQKTQKNRISSQHKFLSNNSENSQQVKQKSKSQQSQTLNKQLVFKLILVKQNKFSIGNTFRQQSTNKYKISQKQNFNTFIKKSKQKHSQASFSQQNKFYQGEDLPHFIT